MIAKILGILTILFVLAACQVPQDTVFVSWQFQEDSLNVDHIDFRYDVQMDSSSLDPSKSVWISVDYPVKQYQLMLPMDNKFIQAEGIVYNKNGEHSATSVSNIFQLTPAPKALLILTLGKFAQ